MEVKTFRVCGWKSTGLVRQLLQAFVDRGNSNSESSQKDASDTEIKYPESEACICTPCWFSFDAYGWVLQQVSFLIYPSDLVNKFPGPLHSCVPLSTCTFRILWTPLHQSIPWLLRYQKFESNFSLVFLNLNTTWESSILACCHLSPRLCSPSMSVRVCTRMVAIVRTNCWMGNIQQKISLLMPTILHSNIESLKQEATPYFCKSFVDSCVLCSFMCFFDGRFSTGSFCHCADW